MSDYFNNVRRILFWILLLNWAVALAKLAYGIITHCSSMVADGVHSFSDGATNVIGLLGIWIAAKPVDKNHPYGHKKYETFAALTVAFLLFLLALVIVHESLERLKRGLSPDVNFFSFVVIVVTMGVNIFVMVYEKNKGKALGSDLLIADALHTRSDILVSLGVIVALVSARLGYPALDSICAFIIAGFIVKTGFDIARCTTGVLCDSAALAVGELRKVAMEIKGVKECHRIRTRGRADDIHVDLHLIVDRDMPVGVAHDISDRVEEKIKRAVKGVTDVVVHIEPSPKSRV